MVKNMFYKREINNETPEEEKKRNGFEIYYTQCVYSGISKQIAWESEHGTEDKTDELTYACERYEEEHIVSGKYLFEELEKYKQIVKERLEQKSEKKEVNTPKHLPRLGKAR